MIGYKIGSQSISKQTENQIREEANKLLTKINCTYSCNLSSIHYQRSISIWLLVLSSNLCVGVTGLKKVYEV